MITEQVPHAGHCSGHGTAVEMEVVLTEQTGSAGAEEMLHNKS